jgi:hypothetical protein
LTVWIPTTIKASPFSSVTPVMMAASTSLPACPHGESITLCIHHDTYIPYSLTFSRLKISRFLQVRHRPQNFIPKKFVFELNLAKCLSSKIFGYTLHTLSFFFTASSPCSSTAETTSHWENSSQDIASGPSLSITILLRGDFFSGFTATIHVGLIDYINGV